MYKTVLNAIPAETNQLADATNNEPDKTSVCENDETSEQPELLEMTISEIQERDSESDGSSKTITVSDRYRYKFRKQRKSPVWNFFEVEQKPGRGKAAVCHICYVRLSFQDSTSSLRKHLIAKHPKQWDNVANTLFIDSSHSYYDDYNDFDTPPSKKNRRNQFSFIKEEHIDESNNEDKIVLSSSQSSSTVNDNLIITSITTSPSPNLPGGGPKFGVANVIERVTPLIGTFDIADDSFDTILIVAPSIKSLTDSLEKLQETLFEYIKVDDGYMDHVLVLPTTVVPGGRSVFSFTGALTQDYDNINAYRDAAILGMQRLIKAGGKRPLLIVPTDRNFLNAAHVATLGVLQAIYTPLKENESYRTGVTQAEMLGLFCENEATPENSLVNLSAIECGRILARDMCIGDSEKMTPPYSAQLILKMFDHSSIKTNVYADLNRFERDFPLLYAVARNSSGLSKLAPRIVFLEYTSDSPVKQSVFIIGAGSRCRRGKSIRECSHRETSGAAAVAGLFQVLHMTKPPGVKFVGALIFTHNSSGRNAFQAGDVIRSWTGKRVKVGDVSHDSPLIIADVLARFRKHATNETNPIILTLSARSDAPIIKSQGQHTIAVENGPGRQASGIQQLKISGDDIGDFIEERSLHKEHYEVCKGDGITFDLMHAPQDGNAMTDAAFLIQASGLDENGLDSNKPLPYIHLDLTHSAGTDLPSAAPIAAISHCLILN